MNVRHGVRGKSSNDMSCTDLELVRRLDAQSRLLYEGVSESMSVSGMTRDEHTCVVDGCVGSTLRWSEACNVGV